ncbi:hypothetical protein BD413DRAFT_566835 [Trametes elegans]|nr:hypothetical protein BD413DRAFT_566835 [Trametes elegans]
MGTPARPSSWAALAVQTSPRAPPQGAVADAVEPAPPGPRRMGVCVYVRRPEASGFRGASHARGPPCMYMGIDSPAGAAGRPHCGTGG